jgi:uncharacterized protein YbbC (DUF1343 family)
MKRLKTILLFTAAFISTIGAWAQSPKPGADRLDLYLPALKGKRVGIFANHTSRLSNGTHVVDTLRSLGVQIKAIFGPEHGFRGTADAGAKVGNYVDEQTGIPVISLYGSKRRPSGEDLKEIDVLIFDIQDVGTRFYTYISSLQEFMEAALIHGRPLYLLDRPNPNGHYVDGPVLDRAFASFIGMQPVPVVYGMTMGEYAKMLIGESWLSAEAMKALELSGRKGSNTPLSVIPCDRYTHKSVYKLPVPPSPNLPDMSSIYWYPSTCFFEGTVLSEGRGTQTPFQVFGHPSLPSSLYAFTPRAMYGAANPKLKDQLCYGWTLASEPESVRKKVDGKLQLSYLIEAYRLFPEKDKFFILPKSGDPKASFFNKLAGNAILMQQLKDGVSEIDIRNSWEPGLLAFKKVRAKYLLYP